MKRPKLHILMAGISLLIPGIAAQSQTGPTSLVYAGLSGAWVGGLEYRDYTSNQRVLLPTILDVKKTRDGNSLVFHYIYDDGPTKVVDESETATISAKDNTYVTVSSDGKQSNTDTVSGLAAYHITGGKLVRFGKGTENGAPVDVRTTLTISRQRLTILKETRPAGKPFAIRDEYTLTRVSSVLAGS